VCGGWCCRVNTSPARGAPRGPSPRLPWWLLALPLASRAHWWGPTGGRRGVYPTGGDRKKTLPPKKKENLDSCQTQPPWTWPAIEPAPANPRPAPLAVCALLPLRTPRAPQGVRIDLPSHRPTFLGLACPLPKRAHQMTCPHSGATSLVYGSYTSHRLVYEARTRYEARMALRASYTARIRGSPPLVILKSASVTRSCATANFLKVTAGP
jgi:hypothetical protein